MKWAAIIGSIGLISIATYSYKHQSQPIVEPVISGVEIPVTVPLETKTETPIEQVVRATKSIKVAFVPKTETEQDTEIDQNTIKNVEQDQQINELDNRVDTIEAYATPYSTPYATPYAYEYQTPYPTPYQTPADPNDFVYGRMTYSINAGLVIVKAMSKSNKSMPNQKFVVGNYGGCAQGNPNVFPNGGFVNKTSDNNGELSLTIQSGNCLRVIYDESNSDEIWIPY